MHAAGKGQGVVMPVTPHSCAQGRKKNHALSIADAHKKQLCTSSKVFAARCMSSSWRF